MVNILSADIGTTNVKAGVFDEHGRLKYFTSERLRILFDQPGSAVQDPDEIFHRFVNVCKKAVEFVEGDVDALILSSQMHGLTLLNREGKPIVPLITYLDTRCSSVVGDIEHDYGRDLYENTGCPPLFIYPLSKILWLKKTFLHRVKEVKYVLVSAKDYVIYRLLGKVITDYSTASGSQLFNVKRLDWDSRSLDIAGIQYDMLPRLVDGFKPLDDVDKGFLKILGISGEPIVMLGGSDAALHSLGVGVLGDGSLALNLGTSAAIRVTRCKPIVDRYGMRFFCYYLGYKKWIIGGATNNAGSVLDWLKERLFRERDEEFYDFLEKIDIDTKPCPSLIFIPFLSGERFPVRDSYARGLVYGLSFNTSREDIIRSALEGIGFTLYWIYAAMNENNIIAKSIFAAGGGSRIKLWLRILSNIFNLPLYRASFIDASLLGGVIVALKEMGYFSSLEDAVKNIVNYGLVFHPKVDYKYAYEKSFRLFKGIYDSIKNTKNLP